MRLLLIALLLCFGISACAGQSVEFDAKGQTVISIERGN